MDVAAAGRCAERWTFSAEEFVSARRSEQRACKALWLGVDDAHENGRVDLHPSLVESVQAAFQSMPFDRGVFENCTIHHRTAQVRQFSVWRCLQKGGGDITGWEGKAYVLGLRLACRSSESSSERILFMLDNMALVMGSSKGRGSARTLNHTCCEVCVISQLSLTILVCAASEDNPADEPSRSKRNRAPMHDDVDRCGTSAPWAAADTELLSVLCAEAARMASEEAPPRKHSGTRSCTGLAGQNR